MNFIPYVLIAFFLFIAYDNEAFAVSESWNCAKSNGEAELATLAKFSVNGDYITAQMRDSDSNPFEAEMLGRGKWRIVINTSEGLVAVWSEINKKSKSIEVWMDAILINKISGELTRTEHSTGSKNMEIAEKWKCFKS